MKRSAAGFRYFLVEGIRSIFLHGFMSFAAVGVIVACLIIMGSFTLLAANVDSMIRDVQQQNQITVYIHESLTDAEARSVGSALAITNVKKAEFMSREEAMLQFIDSISQENNSLFDGYDEADADVLRHRYYVTLMDISKIDDTIQELEAIPGVVKIRVDFKVAQALTTMRTIVQVVSAALIAVLLLVSVFIISNTIKLTTFDRREEIGIMRIVGATKAFIRWPFVVQGILLGLLASSFGFFLQWGLYSWLTNMLLENFRITEVISFIEILPFTDMMLPVAASFMLIGIVVGVGGSLLTIRKFLQV